MAKIALLGYFFGPRLGVGVFIDRFLANLDSIASPKHDVTFFTNRNTRRALSTDLTRIRVEDVSSLNAGSMRAAAWAGLRFPDILASRNFDIAVILTNPIVLRTSIPVISVIHDLNEFAMPEKFGPIRSWYRRNLMIKSAVKHSDGIVVISKFVERQLQEFFPDGVPGRVCVIPNGVDAPPYPSDSDDAILRHYSLTPEKYFLVVGRIDPVGKNLHAALRTYKQLERRSPGMQLVLVGGINKMCEHDARTFLDMIANDDYLSTRVRHLGYVPDESLAAMYRHAAGLLFMSRYEGFGFPMIEAFKSGCPVIYNRECEVLHEHAQGAAIAVTDEDNAALPDTCNMLFDPGQRITLRRRMETVAKQYDWYETVKRYIDFIEHVAGEKV